MQAQRSPCMPNQIFATAVGMPSGRPPAYGEPTDDELRIRLRKWVQYYWTLRDAKGAMKKDYAEELGLSAVTISNVLNEVTPPGLDMLAALHFRLGLHPRDLLREDPPPFTFSPHKKRPRGPRKARRDTGQTKVRTEK
jgi:transcriptional regulator with XRE-family HTH domain